MKTEKPYTMKNITGFINRFKNDEGLRDYADVQILGCNFDWYWNVSEISIMNGFEVMYDIGCAYGLQGDIARQNGMRYVGVENQPETHMYEKEGVSYIIDQYPCKIKPSYNALAVSHLCVGWNCFFPLPEDKEAAYKQLAEDFSTVILHIPEEEIPRVDKYFKRHFDLDMADERVNDNDMLVVTYLFTNIEEDENE